MLNNFKKGNMVRVKNGHEENCLGLVTGFNQSGRYSVRLFGTIAKAKKNHYQIMYFTRFDLELLK